MNKAQLIEIVAPQLGGRKNASDAVDAVLDAIVRAVVSGDRVSVTGFGSFEKVDRPARYARNPQTGEKVRVKKTSVPRFRAGQGFKDLVGGGKKLPKDGPSVRKAPKGSLTEGASAPAKKTAKKAAAKKATAKKAAAKKTAAKKTAAKKATVRTAAASTARKTATARTGAAKKAAAKKAPASKTAARKTATKKTAAKKTTAKKAAVKKTAAKKTTAKKAPAKKTAARRGAKK
ncbi:DNA-binding protein [Mangrovactinospora gilvigrisea]|uniref:DNA-binding protein n=1 Tax=Mangrovactinospora gilvigrisea TaxID=1428644 RepID=A0A1J7BVZ5_9ACTN|nr:HU family DNA-binding protein [Mangrovactinospora gilvigrisea]OIV37641.1 DNA-binding protein [Mangrovactinospora gilvigrisea]